MRDFSNFSSDGFNDDLSNVNALFVNDSRDVNSVFSSFYDKFNKLMNKHTPMKTISKRKAKLLSKPWITKGLRLRISVKIKNKLYASGDMIKYKVYRKKLCSLIRLSKQRYYTKFFDDILNNMKKTWQGITDILSRNSKNTNPIQFLKDPNNNHSISSDPRRIANIINEHFSSIGPNLANKLPPAQDSYLDFLNASAGA